MLELCDLSRRSSSLFVVELLSPGTEAEDLGQTLREMNQPSTKWQVYEQILRVPYYVLFDRYENQGQVSYLDELTRVAMTLNIKERCHEIRFGLCL